MTKQVATTLKMMPLFENVSIPFVSQFIGEGGEFTPNEVMEKAADTMLAELRRVSDAMAPLRA